MSAKIIELGPHENMTAEQALGVTLRESPSEVLILYYDSEGTLGIRSSTMSNKDALWILRSAERDILEDE